MKRCPVCATEKQESEFSKNKSAYDGLQTYCKKCQNQKMADLRKKEKEIDLICIDCGQTKPREDFSKKRKSVEEGWICNICRKTRKAEYMKEFNEKHREERLEYLKKYRQTHEPSRSEESREKANTKQRERYANDPEYRQKVLDERKARRENWTEEQKEHYRSYMREFQRKPEQQEKGKQWFQDLKADREAYEEYRKKHNEYRKTTGNRNEKTRQYRKDHPEVYKAREHRRRVREKNGTVITENIPDHLSFLKEWQENYCYFCNLPLSSDSKDQHVEHLVPLSRNGTHRAFNIAYSCPQCNGSKASRILWKEWKPKYTQQPKFFRFVEGWDDNVSRLVSTFFLSDRVGLDSSLFLERFRSENPDPMLFFDWEWLNRKEAVQNLIDSRLKKYEPVSAHKLTVSQIDCESARVFLDKHHLQGFTNGSVYLGLKKEEELRGVAVFKEIDTRFEFCRLAFKGAIMGGLTKIFNYFMDNHNKERKHLYTYSDLRYATGKTFEQLGFQSLGDTSPHSSYVGPGGMFHRMTMMKRDMEDRFDFFDPLFTEVENAKFNGYYRVTGLKLRRYAITP